MCQLFAHLLESSRASVDIESLRKNVERQKQMIEELRRGPQPTSQPNPSISHLHMASQPIHHTPHQPSSPIAIKAPFTSLLLPPTSSQGTSNPQPSMISLQQQPQAAPGPLLDFSQWRQMRDTGSRPTISPTYTMPSMPAEMQRSSSLPGAPTANSSDDYPTRLEKCLVRLQSVEVFFIQVQH